MPFAHLNALATTATPWFVSEWKAIVAMAAIAGIVLWIWKRTGSSHVLNAILWRRFIKQRTDGPPWLSGFLDERDHLMSLRAQAGLTNAPTLAAGERVVAWTREHDLDMDRVAEVRSLIDYDRPGLKEGSKPSLSAIRTMELFSGLLFLVAITVATLGAITPSAIKVVQSQVWYAVQPDHVKRMFHAGPGRAPVFRKTQCADQAMIATRTAYPAHDIAVLCNLMGDEDGVQAIDDARRGQWVLAAAATLWLLGLGGKLRRQFRRDKVALAMHERLEQRTAQRAIAEHSEPRPHADGRALESTPVADTQPAPAREPTRQSEQEASAPKTMTEIQYLWDHWKFNADQRIKAFNFFVVFSVFANGGLFTAVDKGAHPVVLAVIGTFITLLASIFWMIDSRSRALIRLSEPGIKRFEESLWHHSRLFHRDQTNADRLARYSNSFRVLFVAQLVLGISVVSYAIARGFGLAQSWLPALTMGNQ